jgi:hypothetical protein
MCVCECGIEEKAAKGAPTGARRREHNVEELHVEGGGGGRYIPIESSRGADVVSHYSYCNLLKARM